MSAKEEHKNMHFSFIEMYEAEDRYIYLLVLLCLAALRCPNFLCGILNDVSIYTVRHQVVGSQMIDKLNRA
jgi:hypothetical protein